MCTRGPFVGTVTSTIYLHLVPTSVATRLLSAWPNMAHGRTGQSNVNCRSVTSLVSVSFGKPSGKSTPHLIASRRRKTNSGFCCLLWLWVWDDDQQSSLIMKTKTAFTVTAASRTGGIKQTPTVEGNLKVKLFLCLTKHHIMKMYGGMEV